MSTMMSSEVARQGAEQHEEKINLSMSTRDMAEDDRKMLRSIYLRSFGVFAVYTAGARGGADGFLYALMPAFKRYYPDKERFRDAMVRHSSWYNITQAVGTFCMGLVAAMERENSETTDFDTNAIDAIKTSLMGPMSGIGDAIFWGVVRVIAAAVGMAVAAQTGSVLGPLLFLAVYNIPHLLIRWWLTVIGFRLGSSFISRLYEGGLMKMVTRLAGILGMLMLGAMTASFVHFSTLLSIPVPEGDPVMIQTHLDAIFKGLVPLLVTLGCVSLLKKGVNVIWIILGIMVICVALGLLGIV